MTNSSRSKAGLETRAQAEPPAHTPDVDFGNDLGAQELLLQRRLIAMEVTARGHHPQITN